VILIGLTGGIASGKSHVSRYFENAGVPVIHADQLAREAVLEGSPGWLAVKDRFPDAFGPDGTLDRSRLARRIFASEADRKDLERILHPRIRNLFRERVRSFEGKRDVLVYEVPLLFEIGLDRDMDFTVSVDVPVQVQRERLKARNGLDDAEIDRRLASQLPREERNRRADRVVSGELSDRDLSATVQTILEEVKALQNRRES
jgi:dephospho-CoA kinase